jgi:hypothetical protein
MACRYGRNITLLEAKYKVVIRGSDEICAVMSPNTPRSFPSTPRLDNRSVPAINSEVTSDRNPEYRHCHGSGIESARTHNVPSYLVSVGGLRPKGPPARRLLQSPYLRHRCTYEYQDLTRWTDSFKIQCTTFPPNSCDSYDFQSHGLN